MAQRWQTANCFRLLGNCLSFSSLPCSSALGFQIHTMIVLCLFARRVQFYFNNEKASQGFFASDFMGTSLTFPRRILLFAWRKYLDEHGNSKLCSSIYCVWIVSKIQYTTVTKKKLTNPSKWIDILKHKFQRSKYFLLFLEYQTILLTIWLFWWKQLRFSRNIYCNIVEMRSLRCQK